MLGITDKGVQRLDISTDEMSSVLAQEDVMDLGITSDRARIPFVINRNRS